jgi:putative ABC transport system permease protein
MSVVVDEAELERLGVAGIGDTAEINKQRIRIVGTLRGLKSLAGPYVFCSQHTARKLLQFVVPMDHCTYLIAKTKNSDDAVKVVEELKERYKDAHDMSIFTSREFSIHSRLHWLMKTKAGIAIGYAALLGLLVGMVVTSQTLYAATAASAREFGILLALGIPRWRVSLTVLSQSFWVGFIGTVLAYPTVLGLAKLAEVVGVKVLLPTELLLAAAGITMAMAMIAGLMALRSVRKIEPMTLLR